MTAKRCETCHWFDMTYPIGGNCRALSEPKTMVGPGGDTIAYLSPLPVSPDLVCDLWRERRDWRMNLRKAE